jgi:hypothetical protein
MKTFLGKFHISCNSVWFERNWKERKRKERKMEEYSPFHRLVCYKKGKEIKFSAGTHSKSNPPNTGRKVNECLHF